MKISLATDNWQISQEHILDVPQGKQLTRPRTSPLAGRQSTGDILNLFTFNFTEPVPRRRVVKDVRLVAKPGVSDRAPGARRSPRGGGVAQLGRRYCHTVPPTALCRQSQGRAARALKGHFLRRRADSSTSAMGEQTGPSDSTCPRQRCRGGP